MHVRSRAGMDRVGRFHATPTGARPSTADEGFPPPPGPSLRCPTNTGEHERRAGAPELQPVLGLDDAVTAAEASASSNLSSGHTV